MRPTEHLEEMLSLCAPVSSLAVIEGSPTHTRAPAPAVCPVGLQGENSFSECNDNQFLTTLFSFLGPFKTGKNIKMCAPRHLVLGQPLTINGIECSRASWLDSPAGIHGTSIS